MKKINFNSTSIVQLIAFLSCVYILVSSIMSGTVVVGGGWTTVDDNPVKFWFYISFIASVTGLIGFWILKSLFLAKKSK